MRVLLCLLILLSCKAFPQGTRADYQRSLTFADRIQQSGYAAPGPVSAINKSSKFWYRSGNTFLTVDAATQSKAPSFDHTRLAASLTAATGTEVKPDRLPFNTLTFGPSQIFFEVVINEQRYRIHLPNYAVEKLPTSPRDARYPVSLPGPTVADLRDPLKSPDGKSEAILRNHNIWLRTLATKATIPLTTDGSEGNPYRLSASSWSPDSRKLAVYRLRLGQHRKIAYIESSPADQVQPKHSLVEYAKPGDTLDLPQPVLIDIASRTPTPIDPTLFANPYRLSNILWRKDSRAFTFDYNQRGHQIYRVIEVDALTAKPRALITEQSPTFFCYYSKLFSHHVHDGKELVWMSERDGNNHLYLYDGKTGLVKNQITKGDWVVRSVAKVDDTKRQIWFSASGMHPGKDPYYLHWFRINFDGTGLTPLTNNPDLTHSLTFSEDMQYYVHSASNHFTPPTVTLHRTSDQSPLMQLEAPDLKPLQSLQWQAPQSFTAKGRDGKTDIWGLIFKPTHFDPTKKYPVLEYIYAGPHDSFVPKAFIAASPMQAVAELGFIVVQMDGMGTSNRSKAFHDVAWKNIADAGFPDRILWHKALAAQSPWYDLTRLGIYGHSAGGQNSLGALLFHPDFYKAAASSAGCHDNRMDKISWNEQWMGWPVGPEYTASSNVEHAAKLKGKLLLAVGEMDTNVDPASTMQVVNALIKANKTFDLLVLPGQNHGGWGQYYDRKRADFFVKELLGVSPPNWNTD